MMKKFKLFFKTILAFSLAFTLTACGSNIVVRNVETSNETVAVESIQVINQEIELEPGEFSLKVQCMPVGSQSAFTAILENNTVGVRLKERGDEYILQVGNNAPVGAIIKVRVKSASAPQISDVRSFVVAKTEIVYTPIRTEQQLRAIGESEKALGGNYKLVSDIILEQEWTPLGDALKPFNGKFNGNGYSIKNISMAYGVDFGDATGFFAKIGTFADVKNVGFIGRSANSAVKMATNCGVVAGINEGLIENVFTNVNFLGSDGYAAALVGINNGTIENCYVTGSTVTNSNVHGAGVVGSASASASVISTFADKDTTKLSTFYGAASEQDNTMQNEKLLTTGKMKTADTFSGWDASVWHLQDGFYPMLKNAAFEAPTDTRSIKIINAGEEINVSLYDNGYVPIQTRRINAPHTPIEYTMSETIVGITLDELTGVLHFNVARAGDKQTITLTAKLAGTNFSDTKIYTIVNDGYNANIGTIISTETELYDNLILKSDNSNAEIVQLNMTRKISLGANIELTANKAWPGIEEEFIGNFNGNGYTISGLDVPKSVASSGYGFFKTLKGTAENLTLKGKVDGSGPYVAGLVKNLANGGLIQNVIVDMSVDTDSIYSGKVVGNTFPGSRIVNTIAKGHIGSSLPIGATQAPGITEKPRPSWGPYACGAFIGRDSDTEGNTTPYSITNSIAVRNAGDDYSDIGFTIRVPGEVGEGGSFTNNSLLTFKESLSAASYSGKGFDSSIWHIKDKNETVLKYPGFIEPAAKVYAFINNTDSVYNITDQDIDIALTADIYNSILAPVWSLEGDELDGISINSSTGVITVTAANVAAGPKNIIAKVTINDVFASYIFTILKTEVYDPAVGILIADEDELYKNLIVDANLNNEALVKLNLGRKIVLTADIVLNKYKNWTGIGSKSQPFTGSFDGKGYEISGLDVISTTGQGYGFFMQVGLSGTTGTVIENLALKGSVSGTGDYVSGLVSIFESGTIQNVLVDASVKTNGFRAGKIVGVIKGNSLLQNAIAMGNMSTTNSNASDGAAAWAPFECGALLGHSDDGASYVIRNSYAIRFNYTNDADVGFTIRRKMGPNEASGNTPGSLGDRGKYEGTCGFKTLAEVSNGTAPPTFSTTVWSFGSNGPSLIKPTT